MDRKLICIGRYSNSQNGNIYATDSLSPCLCSGGNGHDATIPKIFTYELKDNTIKK